MKAKPVKAKLDLDDDGRVYGVRILCPGCSHGGSFARSHMLPVNVAPGQEESSAVTAMAHWVFNHNFDAPTLSPSILATHPIWAEDGDREIGKYVCHSFVTDGRIQFLDDCTHALKGQTVDLPDFPTGA